MFTAAAIYGGWFIVHSRFGETESRVSVIVRIPLLVGACLIKIAALAAQRLDSLSKMCLI